MTPLLEPRLLARLERLQLGTRRPLAGALAGEHRSPRHGASLDFADYREYHPGDDFRRIDYHLYARLDVVLLKLFEAEDDVTVRLLIDTSGSMLGAKLAVAQRLAAALGFVALVRRDVVTVHTFPLERTPPRFVGRGAVGALFAHLAGLRAEGRTEFAQAAAHVLARPGPPGLTLLVSDLLTDEWEAGIRRLPARGGDLAVAHVLDAEELPADLVGDLELVDRETGQTVAVSLSAEAFGAYRARSEAWSAEVAERCRQAGAAYTRVRADDDLEALLLGRFRQQGVLR
ncbi:MAG: DUF58 domain-containing protein [Acidimicrobiales bacterium]